MPDGETHFAAGVLAATVAVGAVGYAVLNDKLTYPGVVMWTVVGSGIGILVTPDADQEGTYSYAENLMARIPLFGTLWLACWLPYARVFKHRGVSHSILFGTLTRLVWLMFLAFFWLTVVAGMVAYRNGDVSEWPSLLRGWIVAVLNPFLLLAWWWQDVVHVVLDRAVSWLRS